MLFSPTSKLDHRFGNCLVVMVLSLVVGACGNEGKDGAPSPDQAQSEADAAKKLARARKDVVPETFGKLELPSLKADPKAKDSAKGRQALRVASQGTAAPVIAEPTRVIKRNTPAALMSGALEVLSGSDFAAMARLSRSPANHPKLTEDDAADARRRFQSPSMKVYWQRIAKAMKAGAYTIKETGDEAEVQVNVGGAAGSYRIRLRREGDAWYLVG